MLPALALAGLVGLGIASPSAPSLAQRAPEAQLPFARNAAGFADIVERVKPAVVSIHASTGGRAAQASRKGGPTPKAPEGFPDLPDDHPLNEFFKRFGKGNPGTPMPRQAQGSGFVISADGYVVTNNHVIDGATKIEVALDEQNKFEAELIGTDQRTDLALLKIKTKREFKFVKFADKQPRIGEWVLAIGNPFGLGGTVTAGIVSAHGRDIGTGPYDYMQIDAAVNRGNSGGPTFNLEGEVVGVNTAIFSPSGGNVGIAFAVPAKTVREVTDQLRTKGSVSRGWLGVNIQNLGKDEAESLGLKEAKGALITKVTENGPAAAAGLKSGDAILSVNGEAINDSRDLARKVADIAPGASAQVRILRDGKEQTVSVKLGNFPGGKELAKLEQGKTTTDDTELGISLAPAATKKGAGEEGVVITAIEPDSDAAEKGIRVGDVILDVAGMPVNSPDDVKKGVKKAKDLGRKAVLLKVKTGDQQRFVAVNIKAAN